MATSAQKSLVADADVSAVSLSHVERLYVQRAIDLLAASLERAAKKEMPGSEIQRIRTDEVNMLNALKVRF